MRYAKKQDDGGIGWSLDDERAVERLVRVRRREGPMAPRVTRKMAKLDAHLLAMSRGDELDPLKTVMPPAPTDARAAKAASVVASEESRPTLKISEPRGAKPPPLPIVFPFPFVNPASSAALPAVTAALAEDVINVRDSWLLPPPPSEGSGRVHIQSLMPREPDPFSLRPPSYSLIPR